jgi:transcriptional regulator
MYTQALFQAEEPGACHRLMRTYPLATVVAMTHAGLEAHLLPLAFMDEGPGGRLQGHVGRTHSLPQAVCDGAQVLAVFQSPNAYISPRWYVNGQRSGRLAPSWNYAAVEARGAIRFMDDSQWMRAHLQALTRLQEEHRAQPWSLQDAAPTFIDDAARRLVGFEIDIAHLSGKRFLSQQRTPDDRRSLVEHLLLEPAGAARDVAAMIVP